MRFRADIEWSLSATDQHQHRKRHKTTTTDHKYLSEIASESFEYAVWHSINNIKSNYAKKNISQ